jgi:hypothetical protein
VTVAEFLDRWDRDWAANNISAKTRERYQELIRKQIRPHIGSLAIQKLRASHLAELYAKLLREGRDDGTGLSARTCGHVHRLLHRALGHAAQWDVIQMNVASLVRPPRVPSTELKSFARRKSGRWSPACVAGYSASWQPPCWPPACGGANCWRLDGAMSTSTAPS